MPTPSGYVLVSDAFAKRMANAIMDKTRLSSSITGEAFPSALSTIVTTKDFFNENVIEITDEINYSYTIKGDTNVLDFISRDTLQPFAFQWIYNLVSSFDTNYQWSRYTVATGPYSEFYSAMYYSISGLSNLKEINVDSFKIIHRDGDEWGYDTSYYGYIAQSEYTELLPNLHRINDSHDYNTRKGSMYEDVWDGEYMLFDNVLGIYPYNTNDYYLSIPNCSYIGSGAFAAMDMRNCAQSILTTYSSYSTVINDVLFTKAVLPSELDLTGYTRIGSGAFAGCFSDYADFTSITSPNISYIGGYAFWQCSMLSYISPMPNCSYIGKAAFFSCTNLSSISIPNCSYIGEYTFYGCTNLSSISIPNCSYIDGNAFANCFPDTGSEPATFVLSIPNCSYIGDDAFAYCHLLYSIYAPNCTYLGRGAFNDCYNLTIDLDFNNNTSISYLGDYCTGSITIYGEETELYSNNLIVPDQLNCSMLTYIGDYAFGYCHNLSYISLPNCSYIGSYAFNNCSNLLSISIPNCSFIGSSAFMSCSSLSYISIPNCSYIDDEAFANCSNLSSISIPNCSYIGNYAFYNCTSLTNSNIQDILNTYKSYSTVLNNGVFKGCTGISSLDLTGYTSIGSAFDYCYSLSSISMPNCSYIGDYAFNNCTNLSSISIPNCSYIASYAFSNCSKLTSISIPNCSYIGGAVFNGCYSLASIYVLSTSIPTLNNSAAFYYTPISNSTYLGYFGSIYVLSSLVDSFKTATNWSYYSSRIVAYTGT